MAGRLAVLVPVTPNYPGAMMQQLLWVAVGGAAGSAFRFLCQRALNHASFPYGTLAVNTGGCLLIGIFWALLLKNNLHNTGRLVLMASFCCSFTTISAFTQESIQLIVAQLWTAFLYYVLISVTAGLLATFTGHQLMT